MWEILVIIQLKKHLNNYLHLAFYTFCYNIHSALNKTVAHKCVEASFWLISATSVLIFTHKWHTNTSVCVHHLSPVKCPIINNSWQLLCRKQYHLTTANTAEPNVKGSMLRGQSCCVTLSGISGREFIELRAESSWQWRERGGNAGSQELPTHRCCLLLSPLSGHLNTLAGGGARGEIE